MYLTVSNWPTHPREERDRLLNEECKCIQLLAEKEQIIYELRFLSATLYTCHISGPGLSATANNPTHVIVELSDANSQPCSPRQNVTAELKWPTAIHVMGQFVYVLDQYHTRITVYHTSDQFVISFRGRDLGNLCGITSDCNGLIYTVLVYN